MSFPPPPSGAEHRREVGCLGFFSPFQYLSNVDGCDKKKARDRFTSQFVTEKKERFFFNELTGVCDASMVFLFLFFIDR